MATRRREDADGWQFAFRSLETQIVEPWSLPTEGVLPDGLTGTLYLVGPARHEVYGSRNRTWFDGDGMVHALRIDNGEVTYQNRFVATRKKLAEDKARRRLYASVGTLAPGGRLRRFWRRVLSPANANVVMHDGRLLVLWDGARPYRLDPVTLETLGVETFGGALGPFDSFASNPKVDPDTAELWNFGLTARRAVVLYRCPPGARAAVVAKERLPAPALVRDFALTPTRCVFIVSPLVVKPSVALVAGQRTLLDSLEWRPELGTTVGVIDRRDGACRWTATDPFLVSAVAQGFDDGDDVVVDISTFPNADMTRAAADVMSGSLTTQGYATLERLRIGPGGAVERTRLPPLDSPRLAGPGFSGPDARVFGLALNPVGRFTGLPVAVDVGTRNVTWPTPVPTEIASPPVPVAKPGAASGQDAWVLTVVLDTESKQCELRVLDGSDLSRPALASARLPHVIPFGPRGCWAPAAPAGMSDRHQSAGLDRQSATT